MECTGCGKNRIEQKQIGERCFICDCCKGGICEKCATSTFSSSEIRVLQLKKDRHLIVYCEKCSGSVYTGRSVREIVSITVKNEVLKMREEVDKLNKETVDKYEAQMQNMLKINKDLQDMIETMVRKQNDGNKKLEEGIVELQNKVKEVKDVTLNQTNTEVKSYSQAAKQQDFIVVKPKDQAQKSSITRKDVENKVDPSELGLGISRVRHVQKGGIAIKCSKEGMPVENICMSLEDKLGDQYDVKKLEKKNPKIKIFNVYRKDVEDDEEFVEKILKQNSLEGVKDLKVIHKYELKDERFFNVILEMNKNTLFQLNNRETLNIGWKICKFSDYINVVQCFKCSKYGHIAKYCKMETEVCYKCAGPHRSSECESNSETCSNCKHAAEVLKIPKIDFKHHARDKNCAVYKRIYKEVQQKTDYPEFYNMHTSA